MKLRPIIFWPHLVAGVLAGGVILLMCVTGVLLTYERQTIAWADRGFRSSVPADGRPRLTPEAFLARWSQAHPDVTPTAITIASAPDAPITIAVPQRTLYADAYTGALLGEGSRSVRALMSSIRAWHRWIAVEGENRPLARAITGWANLLFLFIVASGIYLWIPRRWSWQHVRAVVLFNGKASGKARDFNCHNVIGVWSAIPLFIVVASAVPISFPWANALVYRAVGEDVPQQGGREGGPPRGRGGAPAGREGGAEGRPSPEGRTAAVDGRRGGPDGRVEGERRRDEGEGRRRGRALAVTGIDGLMERAQLHVPDWRTIQLRIPNGATAPVSFAIDRGDGGQPQLRSTLTLDRVSGDVVRDERFADQSLGRRIRSVMRFAHTGEVLGIPGQTVAGIVTAGGAVLVWTGIALAFRRLRAWLGRRATARDANPVATRESAA